MVESKLGSVSMARAELCLLIGVHPWLCLVAEGGQNRHIPGCSTKCSEGLDGSVRSELKERIETRLFWVRILYFRHIFISQAPLRPRQFMMRETCRVSGDVLRRLVFFIFVVQILILGHMEPEAISWDNDMEWSGSRRSRRASAHFYCIRRMHLYLCVRRHPQQGRASSLCLDSVAEEVS